MGLVAWALPFELFLLGIPLVRGKESGATPGRIAGDLLSVIVAAALVQVGGPSRTAFGAHPAGGVVGELFGEVARSLFSTAGSFLVGFSCLGLILIGRAAFSFIALARLLARVATRVGIWMAGASRAVAEAWSQARALERGRQEAERAANEPRIDTSPKDDAIVAAIPMDQEDGMLQALAEPAPPRRPRKPKPAVLPDPPPLAPPDPPSSQPEPELSQLSPVPSAAAVAEGTPATPDVASAPAPDADALPAADKKKRLRKAPTIVDTSAALEKERAAPEETQLARRASTFVLPSIDFLVAEKVDPSLSVDREKLLANAAKLVETLAHYGVEGKVEDILPGPTVTTYEVSPAAGTKVSKVAGLADGPGSRPCEKSAHRRAHTRQESHRLRVAQRQARPRGPAGPGRGPALPIDRGAAPGGAGARHSRQPRLRRPGEHAARHRRGSDGRRQEHVGLNVMLPVAPLPPDAGGAAPSHDRPEGRRARARSTASRTCSFRSSPT